eukprot:SM000212S06909  [mRNA]  locus=s212:130952:131788:+ [translate_table: standard]
MAVPAQAEAGAGGGHDLRALHARVRAAVAAISAARGQHGAPSSIAVLIDNAGFLEIIAGGCQRAALAFIHGCRTLGPHGKRCSVVVLAHSDITDDLCKSCPGEPSDASLSLALGHWADTVLSVEPLATGHAVDVHGQVEIVHRTQKLLSGPPGPPPAGPLPPARRLQFRVTESGIVFNPLIQGH